MDNGPFGRTPRPTERRKVAQAVRPEAAPQQSPSIQQRPVGQAAPSTASVPQSAPRRSMKKWIITAVVTLLVVAIAGVAWLFMQQKGAGATGIDANKYQAVFFTNGQTYFGKLTDVNDDYLKLTDIFYLQSQAQPEGDANNPQSEEKSQANVSLIKLGDEIHGPEDKMMIQKSSVLFYENIKADGKVNQSIEAYKKSR